MKKLKLVLCAVCLLISSLVLSACSESKLKQIDAAKVYISDEFVYDGNSHILVAKYDGEVIDEISYSLDNETFKKADEFLDIVGDPDEDKEYLVYFKIELDGYEVYKSQIEVEVELDEIESGITYANLSPIYDGTSKMFIIKHNGQIVENVKFCLTEDGEYVSELNLVNSGTYNVYYKFKKDGYEEFKSHKTFTIEKKELTPFMFSLIDADNLTYSGVAQEPTVLIRNQLVGSSDIDITYSNNVNTGTASVVISAKNNSNFTGSITKTFEIAKLELTDDMFTLQNATGLVYTGAAQTPTVRVESRMVGVNDVNVEYSNNINAGTASVVISAKENSNFTGSVTKTFEIAKKEVTIKANDLTVFKGTEVANLELSAQVTGLVAGESLNYTLTAKDYTTESLAGTSYEIVISEGENSNYKINYTGATMFVTDVVIAAIYGDESVEILGYYSDLNSALENAENETVLILNADIEVDETIVIDKTVAITSLSFETVGDETYTIKASDNFVGSNLFEVSTDVQFVLMGVELNANHKARVIKISAGDLILYGTKITNGLSSSYVGGVFVTGSATVEVIDSEITGNDYVDSNTDTAYYKVYSKDLWIGSQANGLVAEFENATIGNVFVNANEYSEDESGLIVSGGKIDTVYVEYEKGNGAKLYFESGEIKNLLLSTLKTGEWVTGVSIVENTSYTGGVMATATAGELVVAVNSLEDGLEFIEANPNANVSVYVQGEENINNYKEYANEIVIIGDTTLSSTLMLNKDVTINGQGKYSIVASEEFTGNNVIEISTDVSVVLKGLTVDGSNKARVIKISAGELTIEETKITNGLSSSYVGGVFVTGDAQFCMLSGEITGNNYVNSDSDTAYYKSYSKDLWIGSQAAGLLNVSNVSILGGKIGSIFVNANEYSAEYNAFVMNGGEVDTIYVEFDAENGANFTYASGTINHLLISTTTSGVANEVENVVPLMYKGGEDYSNL